MFYKTFESDTDELQEVVLHVTVNSLLHIYNSNNGFSTSVYYVDDLGQEHLVASLPSATTSGLVLGFEPLGDGKVIMTTKIIGNTSHAVTNTRQVLMIPGNTQYIVVRTNSACTNNFYEEA